MTTDVTVGKGAHMPLATLIPIAIVIVIVLIIFLSGFVSASPGEIKVISGPRGQRVVHGKTGWKVPIIERVDKMTAGMIPVDVKTPDFVPTNDYISVKVDAAVKVRIATEDPVMFEAATRNFLYKDTDEIANEVRDTLEGHLRAIIGQMKLTQIVTDRDVFASRVQENAKQDLAEMGLEIVAFNIQGVTDEHDVINNLGIDNTEQIRKDAQIAKANAQRDIALAEAKAKQEANDAEVAAELAIAQKNTDLSKQKAALQVESDTEKAKADAAYDIQKQVQRKEIERQTSEADIVKQEQEAKVKEREIAVTKNSLQSQINAKADADRYAAEQKAQAELFARQKNAEAEAYETMKKAEASKQAMLAEAEGVRAKGEAEAAATAAKLNAEAEGLERKAEAMQKMNDAAVLQMYFDVLPDVARAVAEPLSKVDSITMYGESDSAKIVKDITTAMSQVSSGLKDSVGIDPRELIASMAATKANALTNSKMISDGIKDADRHASEDDATAKEPVAVDDGDMDGHADTHASKQNGNADANTGQPKSTRRQYHHRH